MEHVDHEPREARGLFKHYMKDLIYGANDGIVTTLAIVTGVTGAALQPRIVLILGLANLLADDPECDQWLNGYFCTIYLSPRDYHRVHMPMAGELVAAHYVPGDLFSVNEATVARVPGLFRRNERVNLHFKTAHGPAALIFVGALNAGSISTPWTGEIRPRKRGVVETLDISAAPRDVQKGDLLGWFNMGSTVILLLPEGAAEWHDTLLPGSSVRMGEAIGSLSGNSQ